MSFFNRFFHQDKQDKQDGQKERPEQEEGVQQPEVLPIDREIDALYQKYLRLLKEDADTQK